MDELFDQRRFRRVSAQGQARINFGGRWHVCRIVDLSGGGGSFRAEIKPLLGTNVLVQLRGVGIVRAKVVKRDQGTFGLAFDQSDFDVDAMVDNLMFQANARLLQGGETAEETAPGQQSGRPFEDESGEASLQSRESRRPDVEPSDRLDQGAGRRQRAITGTRD